MNIGYDMTSIQEASYQIRKLICSNLRNIEMKGASTCCLLTKPLRKLIDSRCSTILSHYKGDMWSAEISSPLGHWPMMQDCTAAAFTHLLLNLDHHLQNWPGKTRKHWHWNWLFVGSMANQQWIFSGLPWNFQLWLIENKRRTGKNQNALKMGIIYSHESKLSYLVAAVDQSFDSWQRSVFIPYPGCHGKNITSWHICLLETNQTEVKISWSA